ncbi:hypothetical protein GOP47_0018421 [Adiantum capillus-veneris]|uniref:Uncharacterized protein n=1 Tax=Adiantum capillus-veneris TaxID=13818 RepID=A0A9D4Z9M0_ADICA|nr:hypothetical protein GOP47_0018421 [Adiantum capillus-veneris]
MPRRCVNRLLQVADLQLDIHLLRATLYSAPLHMAGGRLLLRHHTESSTSLLPLVRRTDIEADSLKGVSLTVTHWRLIAAISYLCWVCHPSSFAN